MQRVTVSLMLLALCAVGCAPDPAPPAPTGDHDYTVCFHNPEPEGAETYSAPGWFVTAWADGPVSTYLDQTPGCYYFEGATLEEERESVVLHAIQPCFGDLRPRIEFTRGEPVYLPVTRNDVLCTAEYEVECSHVHDPWIVSIVSDFLRSEVTVQGCCEIYRNTDQPVCNVCPDFDGALCNGAPVTVQDGTCACGL